MKVGGSRAALEQGVLAGRIIRSKVGHLDMYYFPRRQYKREKKSKNILQGIAEKVADDVKHLTNNETEFDVEWDPSSLIPTALETAGIGKLSLPAESSTSSAFPALTFPGPAGSSYSSSYCASCSSCYCLSYIYIYKFHSLSFSLPPWALTRGKENG